MTGNTHPGPPNGASDGGIGRPGNVAGQDDLDDLQRLLQILRGPAQPVELARLTTMSVGLQYAVQQASHAMGHGTGNGTEDGNEDSNEDTVSAAGDPDAGSRIPSHPKERKHMLAKLITLKAAGIIGAGVLTVGTAAAATGTWSGPRPPETNPASTARDRIAALTGASEAEEDTTTTTATTTTSGADGDATDETLPIVDPASVEQECPEGEDAPVNHGEFVSSVAKNHHNDEAAGNHGAVVSDAARSDCGKPSRDDPSTNPATTATSQHEEEELTVTDTNPGPRPANAGSNRGNANGNSKSPNK